MDSIHDRNRAIIEEFRANDGKVGGYFKNSPLLLLHTIGAKSKEERINPLAYTMDGDRFVIIASKGGAPTHPHWYHNLIKHPLVTVEVGTETYQMHAAVAAEPERTRLYDQMAAARPAFADYKQKTTRKIPVIVLTRVK